MKDRARGAPVGHVWNLFNVRSAGLVTVKAEGVQSWRYALRAEGIAGASAALTGYLGSPRD